VSASENLQDSWAIGYTPQLVVGVWVGNMDGRPMRTPFGPKGPAVIWHSLVEAALRGQPAQDFARPPGLVWAQFDPTTGSKPVAGHPVIADWFIDGTLPPGVVA